MDSEWSQSKVVHQQFFNKFADDFDETDMVPVVVGSAGAAAAAGGVAAAAAAAGGVGSA